MNDGLILYGPPGSGKSTITETLHELDPRYQLYPRLKCGPGRDSEYRMITAAQLDQIRNAGDVLYENQRYRSTYVIDRSHLRALPPGVVPVLHLGQVQAVDTVTRSTLGFHWLTVELWCTRKVAEERVRARTTGDTDERLAAYDNTEHLSRPDLRLDTSKQTPIHSALRIIRHQQASGGRALPEPGTASGGP